MQIGNKLDNTNRNVHIGKIQVGEYQLEATNRKMLIGNYTSENTIRRIHSGKYKSEDTTRKKIQIGTYKTENTHRELQHGKYTSGITTRKIHIGRYKSEYTNWKNDKSENTNRSKLQLGKIHWKIQWAPFPFCFFGDFCVTPFSSLSAVLLFVRGDFFCPVLRVSKMGEGLWDFIFPTSLCHLPWSKCRPVSAFTSRSHVRVHRCIVFSVSRPSDAHPLATHHCHGDPWSTSRVSEALCPGEVVWLPF